MSIRIGYQIPNFTYPGGVENIFPTVVAQAKEAEAAGLDCLFMMDHFYQLPGIGTPDDPMMEAYTTLGALAASTERIQLSTLVTGNTYRNPTMLAKAVTTLDAISQGRAVLALGAGWFELEHRELGFEFGTLGERFDRLEEALQIIHPMLRGGEVEHDGTWYQAHGARTSPRLRTDLPIMLGGGGEKKTFRMAAQYADHLNIIASASQLPRKLDALAERCAEVGRDLATLETSYLTTVVMEETHEAAWDVAAAHLQKTQGVDLDTLDDEARAQVLDRMFIGSPDEVAEQVQTRVLDAGVQGIVWNMVPNGHVPGAVTRAAEALKPLVGR